MISSSTDGLNRLQQLKKDIIEQGMIINREMEDDFNRIIQVEQSRFLVKKSIYGINIGMAEDGIRYY